MCYCASFLGPVTPLSFLNCKITAGLDYYSCSNIARMASGTLAGRKEQNLALSSMNKGVLSTVLTVFDDIISPTVGCFLHPQHYVLTERI